MANRQAETHKNIYSGIITQEKTNCEKLLNWLNCQEMNEDA